MCRIGSIEVGEVAKPYTSLSTSAPVRVALRAIGNFLVRGRQTALMFFVEARAIGEPIDGEQNMSVVAARLDHDYTGAARAVFRRKPADAARRDGGKARVLHKSLPPFVEAYNCVLSRA
jgi:hypothetical protein